MPDQPFSSLSCPVVVLRIRESQLRTDTAADALRDELVAAYERSQAVNVIVDAGALVYLSSTGIRPLLALNKRVHEREGRLLLCCLRPEVAEVLTVSRLISSGRTHASPVAFEKHDNIVTAITGLYPSVEPA
jgi:anti-anti-sigma factor